MRAAEATAVSVEHLESIARQLWDQLDDRAVVWLTGDVGTGKTTFARLLTRAAGAQPARSPTYALVHRYDSPSGPIIHADCYRLRSADEAIDLDLHDLRRAARVLLIEWPERAGAHAPSPNVHLEFAHDDDPEIRVIRRLQ